LRQAAGPCPLQILRCSHGDRLADPKQALDRIGQLCAVEATSTDQPPDRRRQKRRLKSKPIPEAFGSNGACWLAQPAARMGFAGCPVPGWQLGNAFGRVVDDDQAPYAASRKRPDLIFLARSHGAELVNWPCSKSAISMARPGYAIDWPRPDCPTVNRSWALLDSAGHPGLSTGSPCREPPPRKRHCWQCSTAAEESQILGCAECILSVAMAVRVVNYMAIMGVQSAPENRCAGTQLLPG
jgi:hypothetical protein